MAAVTTYRRLLTGSLCLPRYLLLVLLPLLQAGFHATHFIPGLGAALLDMDSETTVSSKGGISAMGADLVRRRGFWCIG